MGNGCRSSPHNTANTDNVVPTRSQTLLVNCRLRLFRLRSGRRVVLLSVTAFNRRPLSKIRLSLLFHKAPVVGCVVFSIAAALVLLL
jgi:hypothetical protein